MVFQPANFTRHIIVVELVYAAIDRNQSALGILLSRSPGVRDPVVRTFIMIMIMRRSGVIEMKF